MQENDAIRAKIMNLQDFIANEKSYQKIIDDTAAALDVIHNDLGKITISLSMMFAKDSAENTTAGAVASPAS